MSNFIDCVLNGHQPEEGFILPNDLYCRKNKKSFGVKKTFIWNLCKVCGLMYCKTNTVDISND